MTSEIVEDAGIASLLLASGFFALLYGYGAGLQKDRDLPKLVHESRRAIKVIGAAQIVLALLIIIHDLVKR
jgi:hypothetical protein